MPDSSFSLPRCVGYLCTRQEQALIPGFMNQLCTEDPHQASRQRFWGPLPTLSHSREKQAALVFVCSLCAETGGKLWHPQAQATVSILPSPQLLPCWVCQSFKTGKTDVHFLSSLGEVKALGTQINAFPPQREAEGWDFCLLTLYRAERGSRFNHLYQPRSLPLLSQSARLCPTHQSSKINKTEVILRNPLRKVGGLDIHTNSFSPLGEAES